ncbi:MAG: ankyrin repeat domain-containing protein, partial [Planctomycetota bacterium]
MALLTALALFASAPSTSASGDDGSGSELRGLSFVEAVELPEDTDKATVELGSVRGVPFVAVRINGRQPVQFMVDTGADHSSIDRGFAERSRLPAMGEIKTLLHGLVGERVVVRQLRRVDSMEVGPVHVVTRRLADVDLAPFSRELGVPVRGILGIDVLGRGPVTIDLARSRLTFHRPSSFVAPDDAPITLVPHGGCFGVPGRIGGLPPAPLVVDTGSADSWVRVPYAIVAQYPEALPGPVVGKGMSFGITGAIALQETREADVEVFGRRLEGVPVTVMGGAMQGRGGVLGTMLLRRFELVLDVPGRRLWATLRPPPPIAQRLADGLDPDATDLRGRTPLFEAIDAGDLDGVLALVAAGADVRHADHSDIRPLELAAWRGDVRIVRALMDAGADAQDPAALRGALHGRRSEVVAIVAMLLDAGSPLDARDQAGHTPLSRASVIGEREVAELLIERGADVDVACDHRRTALGYASSFARTDLIRLLVEAGADVRAADELGLTPLHRAATFDS